jgi:hypothetical protein
LSTERSNVTDYDQEAIADLISEARFKAYLREADSKANALELYQWNASMASAMFELVGHLEVVLRNTVDKTLSESWSEAERRIPWFMLKLPGVDARLTTPTWDDAAVDRDAALATLTMGFWAKLIGTPKVWPALQAGFIASCSHDELKSRTDQVHELRNTLAHHGSMLDVDVVAERDNVLSLAGLIGTDVRNWLSSLERVTGVNRTRPNTVPDTVLVPANKAWPLYGEVAAYVCQPGRSIRPVKRMAFYYQGKIMQEVPQILEKRDHVPWTREEATKLRGEGGQEARALARIIERTLDDGWSGPAQQVIFLTRPGATDEGHRRLSRPVPHEASGRGSAFVHKQRYFHFSDLASAVTTADLPKSYFLTEVDAGGRTDSVDDGEELPAE